MSGPLSSVSGGLVDGNHQMMMMMGGMGMSGAVSEYRVPSGMSL